jgi:cytochrome d ubiquinol oxidase subunit I
LVVGAVGAFTCCATLSPRRARDVLDGDVDGGDRRPRTGRIGDLHGVNTYEHQPTKVAAMEGHFDTERGAAAKIFGIPDAKNERLDYGIGIPHLASLYLAHDWNAEIKGLKAYPKTRGRPTCRWSSSRSASWSGSASSSSGSASHRFICASRTISTTRAGS